MKARDMWREAGRNLTSGTTRAVWYFLAFVLIIGILAAAEISQIAALSSAATNYRNVGASVTVLDAPGQIDGNTCEALTTVPGINKAGAVRQGGDRLALTVLPGAPLPMAYVTPNFPQLLDATTDRGAGVIFPGQLTDSLPLEVGDTVPTREGDVRVAGTFAYPDDGRVSGFGYTALVPASANGVFDQCWIEVWPESAEISNMVNLSLSRNPDAAPPTTSKLNSTLGSVFDGQTQFTSRVTRLVPAIAAVAGLALGYLAVHSRRLEAASNLHVGVTRRDQGGLFTIETLAWLLPAAILVMSGGLISIAESPIIDPDTAANHLLLLVVCGVSGVLIGAAVAWSRVRESQLFDYFKHR